MRSRLDRRALGLVAAAAILAALAFAPASRAGLARTAAVDSPTRSNPVATWRFTVEAAVAQAVADHYGGPAAVSRLVEAQLGDVSSRFNDPGVFERRIKFVLDRFYVYPGAVGDEVFGQHPGYDYRVVYGSQEQVGGGWYGGFRSIYARWPVEILFTETATDALTHEIGHARGAIDVYALGVPPQGNPINGEGYTPDPGIMTYPYGVRTWDRHSVSIINRNTDVVDIPISYITESFPAAMRVRVVRANGRRVADAKVELFPVEWFSNRVQEVAAVIGTTNRLGGWGLPSNPFGPNTPTAPWFIRYANFLVRASARGAVGYAWMPLTDVQNRYFENPSGTYLLTVVVR